MPGLARAISSTRAGLGPAFVLASLLVIASCDKSNGPRTGKLSLTVSGLPTGTAAQVTLSGPANFSRVITGTEVVSNLQPGEYTLTPASVFNGLTRYSSITAAQTVTITKSDTPVDAAIAYSVSSANLTVNIDGTPTGATTAVRVTGPKNFNQIVSATTTFPGVEPGSYFVVAPEIVVGQQRFTADRSSQQVQLSAGLNATAIFVHYAQITGNITFAVNGLPNGITADIGVTGPVASYVVGTSSDLVGVRAGQYTITVKGITVATKTYIPNFSSQAITLTPAATALVTVNYTASDGPLNLTIDGVTLTQVVQTYTGTVPLVAGRDAYIRVFARASQSVSSTAQVRVRFYTGATLIHTMLLSNAVMPIVPDQASLATSWNGIVLGQFIQPGLKIVADVDPTNEVVEGSETDNSFPASGTPLDVDVRQVPTLRLTFVPIIQRFDKAMAGNVSDANKEQFLGDARRMLPLLDIDAQVHAPYTTSDSLELTSNDGNNEWLRVLSEMNTLRVAESSQRNYFGVVKVSYNSGVAGYGYVPGRAAVGWDYLPSGRNVAAHELTHNFGRFHAPCGGVGGPDPNYPYAGGTIGVYGYDLSANALRLPSSADIMGYCNNPWISDYNYVGAMDWRASNSAGDVAGAALGLAQDATPRPSLLVWGHIERGQLVLEPSFSIVARPNVPHETGPYRIEGVSRNGRAVFSYSFAGERPADIDDPTARHFAFAIPMDETTQADLASIRLTGPGATPVTMQAAVAPGGIAAAVNAVDASAAPSGRVSVRWDGQAARMALIRDRQTGQVLSFARGGSAHLRARSTDLEVVLSDGVRSVTRRVRVTK